jgi:hypothetical protein
MKQVNKAGCDLILKYQQLQAQAKPCVESVAPKIEVHRLLCDLEASYFKKTTIVALDM